MNKTIIITGGTEGLGKYLATELSKKHTIIILGTNRANLENMCNIINCEYYVCDVSDFKQVENIFSLITNKHSKIDVLINNAGLYINGKLEDNDPNLINDVLNVNLLGTINCSKYIIPSMKSANEGLIININSQLGKDYRSERSIYSSSKWGISGFTYSLQEEVSNSGIKVTNLLLGSLDKTMRIQGTKYSRNLSYLSEKNVLNSIEFIMNMSNDVLISEINIKSVQEYK